MGLKNIILCAAAAIGLASCAKTNCTERIDKDIDGDNYGKYIGYECEVTQSEGRPLLSYGHISLPDKDVSLPNKETCYARSTNSHHQEAYIDYGCNNIVEKLYNVNSFYSSGEPDVVSFSREQSREQTAYDFFKDSIDPIYLRIKDEVLNKVDKEKYR